MPHGSVQRSLSLIRCSFCKRTTKDKTALQSGIWCGPSGTFSSSFQVYVHCLVAACSPTNTQPGSTCRRQCSSNRERKGRCGGEKEPLQCTFDLMFLRDLGALTLASEMPRAWTVNSDVTFSSCLMHEHSTCSMYVFFKNCTNTPCVVLSLSRSPFWQSPGLCTCWTSTNCCSRSKMTHINWIW